MEGVITKKEVIETIGFGLEEKLKPNGFKYVKSKGSLIRKYKGGFDQILLTTWDGFPLSHQELKVHLATRIDEVENIMWQFFDERFRNPKFAKTSTTTSFSYVDLTREDDKVVSNGIVSPSHGSFKDFVINKSQDIYNAKRLLIEFILETGLSHFEHFRDKRHLNNYLKGNLLDSPDSIPYPMLMKAMILMKLTNDKEYLDVKNQLISKLMPAYGFEKESKVAFTELESFLEANY